MISSSKKSRGLFAIPLLLLCLLFQGCLGSIQYRAYPRVQASTHTDIWNFSNREIAASQVDLLYGNVAQLMAITPERSKPRPQVLVVSPAYIQEKYLTIYHSAKIKDGVPLALYVPYQNQILIPYLDNTLLAHELAHYFTFHYHAALRSDWEAIADRVVGDERFAP